MKIYQIEIANHCNLVCSYCPQPVQRRPYGFMSWDTYRKSIALVQECGQSLVYLHNFGEPLLHPFVVDFVRYATDQGLEASFFTNGILLDESSLRALHYAGLRRLAVSEHTRGEAERVKRLIESTGVHVTLSDVFRPVRSALHSWAGQTVTKSSGAHSNPTHVPCIFERQNAAVILWDGSINVCCIDAEGRGIGGTVDDFLGFASNYAFAPIKLCNRCTLMRGEETL